MNNSTFFQTHNHPSKIIGFPCPIRTGTHRHRRSPNVAVRCHSRMELRPPTARKSHPNFFAHCKRSTKMKKYKKNYHPKCAKHNQNASHPNGLKLWKIINKTIYFDSQTPCERMIHVCLGRISLFYKTHLIRMLKV